MLEKYKTVYEGGEGEIVEKKSRFIAMYIRWERTGNIPDAVTMVSRQALREDQCWM